MNSMSTINTNGINSRESFRSWVNDHALFITVSFFLIFKILLFIFYFIIYIDLNDTPGDRYTRFHTGIDIIDLLGTRWDSSFYIGIAEFGYGNDFDFVGDYRLWVFPPLYSILIRLLVDLSPISLHYATAAVVISNFFAVLSVIVFFYTSRLYVDKEKAIMGTMLFAFFPPVFVFSTVAYTESIFLTLSILSWYFFEKERYLTSGIFLALSTLARNEGALLFFIYFAIYIGRRFKREGLKTTVGSMLAIPLFPILLLINGPIFLIKQLKTRNRMTDQIKYIETYVSLPKMKRFQDYLDMRISWVLICGLVPLIWLLYINSQAPIPLDQIRVKHWGATFSLPLAGFFDFIDSGRIKWMMEKYTFVFLFLIIGFFSIKKRPEFTLSVTAQIMFYTAYIAGGWSIARYVGSIFHGPLALNEELTDNPKLPILIFSVFFMYSFKVLWEFTHWSMWLI